MAKHKITTDEAYERAEGELNRLVEAMAGRYVSGTYDRLLEAAARLKHRLPAGYRPTEVDIPATTTTEKGASVLRLEMDFAPYGSPLYRALMKAYPTEADDRLLSPYRGTPAVPFPFSDHPDAVDARLVGAYRALRDRQPETRA
ncbi:MAG TPA: hypothetical protein VFV19_02965 [Candidatus Polarisedimenticolaceae bacterium]|nr:hypothetical protein [Candidatus Polarisedimenticolaceae bacterium]